MVTYLNTTEEFQEKVSTYFHSISETENTRELPKCMLEGTRFTGISKPFWLPTVIEKSSVRLVVRQEVNEGYGDIKHRVFGRGEELLAPRTSRV